MAQDKSSIWGGVFSEKPSDLLEEINASISFDKKLWQEDIKASIAHSKMLAKQNIISESEADEIISGLGQIRTEIVEGKFNFKAELEDIHMNIESRLREIIGATAGKLHTARSRNDQVATDFKLYVLQQTHIVEDLLADLIKTLLTRAAENISVILPGYTHLQPAQPISFAHHLLAYLAMFERDLSRFSDLHKRHNFLPLGSAALAGTPYQIDRDFVAKELGFASVSENSLDAVSSRDFALEFMANAAILMSNLSRIAEELVLWMSPGFSFISLSDSFTTGSSIMPQKKNPDAAELVRGKSGRVYGDLISLLTVMKSLPLAYSKDMQEDKEPLFDSAETIIICLKLIKAMLADMEVNADKMLEHTEYGYLTATDLADYLVSKCGIAFRDAHHITGNVVKYAITKQANLSDLSLVELQKFETQIQDDVYEFLSVRNSLNSRNSYGGTSEKRVKEMVQQKQNKYFGEKNHA